MELVPKINLAMRLTVPTVSVDMLEQPTTKQDIFSKYMALTDHGVFREYWTNVCDVLNMITDPQQVECSAVDMTDRRRPEYIIEAQTVFDLINQTNQLFEDNDIFLYDFDSHFQQYVVDLPDTPTNEHELIKSYLVKMVLEPPRFATIRFEFPHDPSYTTCKFGGHDAVIPDDDYDILDGMDEIDDVKWADLPEYI